MNTILHKNIFFKSAALALLLFGTAFAALAQEAGSAEAAAPAEAVPAADSAPQAAAEETASQGVPAPVDSENIVTRETIARKKKAAKPAAAETLVNYFASPQKNQTNHLEPYTKFALGLGLTNFNFAFGSDLPISPLDIFSAKDNKWKKDNRLVLDFDRIAEKRGISKNGLDINAELALQDIFRLEFGLGKFSGLGISIGGLTSRFDLNLDNRVFDMLANGITTGEVDYGFAISGALFAQTLAVNWHKRSFLTKKLFLSITGSHYVPLIYIPKSNLNVKLTNTNYIEAGLEGEARVYMPINAFKIMEGEMPSQFDWGGVDLSLQAEYALFPVLDLGLSALNIPLIPAALHTQSTLKFDPRRNSIFRIDDLVNNNFDITIDKLTDWERTDGFGAIYVTRPMRFDFYALFRPLRKEFLVLRPNVGFTTLNPSEKTYFNFGLNTALNAGRTFTMEWFTGAYDGLWRNKLVFDLRIWKIARAFLNLEMRSQDYAGSWTLKGLGVAIGFKWGGGFNGLTNF